MARPRKKIDPEQVIKLAAINCSYEEIGAVLKCSPDTLERRFAGAIKEGRANGRMSLKRKQYEVAMSGNVGMLVWLGKQLLGQAEKNEVKMMDLPDEVIAKEVERRLAQIRAPERLDDPA